MVLANNTLLLEISSLDCPKNSAWLSFSSKTNGVLLLPMHGADGLG